MMVLAALGAVAIGCRDTTEPRDPAAAIDLSAVPATIGFGDTVAASIRVLDAAGHALANHAATIASSAPDVVQVLSDGRLIGRATGSAVVHVETSGGNGTIAADVTIAVSRPAQSIDLAVREPNLSTDDTMTVVAQTRDRRGLAFTGSSVRFASSDTAVLAVDAATGLVRARNEGAADVTATAGSATQTISLVVSLPRIAFPRAVTALSMGYYHACALVDGGDAYCWGLNGSGQLGNGDRLRAAQTMPTRVPGGLHFVSIDAAGRGTCGMTAEPRVYCWGEGWLEPLAGAMPSVPTEVTFGDGSQRAARVSTHDDGGACVVDTDGSAWCWGSNRSAQIGDAAIRYFSTPRRVPGNILWSEFTPRLSSSCGISVDRAVFCLGYPSYLTRVGAPGAPIAVPGASQAREVAVGWSSSCILDLAGVASCAGDNYLGTLGRAKLDTLGGLNRPLAPIDGSLRFTAIRSGGYNVCALTAAGELWCWGLLSRAVASRTTPTGVPHLFSRQHRFLDFAVGPLTACGLTSGGEVYCGTREFGIP